MDTVQQQTWPPPPDLPDPLAAHDAFLTALICAPVMKTPLTRLRLVMALVRAKRVNSRQSRAFVDDYCERYSVFPQPQGLKAWLPALPSLAQVGPTVSLLISQARRGAELAAAPTHLARHFILGRQLQLDILVVRLMIVVVAAVLINLWVGVRRTHREAEEVRQRIMDEVGAICASGSREHIIGDEQRE